MGIKGIVKGGNNGQAGATSVIGAIPATAVDQHEWLGLAKGPQPVVINYCEKQNLMIDFAHKVLYINVI